MNSPYNLSLNADVSYSIFTEVFREELFEEFSTLYKKYTANYHNIIIGEMGIINKNNIKKRIEETKY